ncbi:MAG: 2-hydroxychromene-2-carboxylate isomerase [Alphaproteobacteria bacterium]|nr:2-hydroxychromene-2-carboxylate isomerase [Alphaproteobacteria bacterium]
MSDKQVLYFFAVLSPFCNLGHPTLHEVAARHGADLVYKPADFFKVFEVSGGLKLHERAQQRQAYRLIELERWAAHRGLPLNLHPKFFPADQTLASRMVLAALEQGPDPGDFVFAYQRAIWEQERDIADRDTGIAIADEAGLDGHALMARAETDEIGAQYDANTAEAIERNLFGPPSYLYRDELFWGQDRLDFLDRALAAH